MAFLNSIEQIRAIDWGRKHDWDLKFPNAPAPFRDWFPAVDVEEPLAVHEAETLQISNTSVQIPSQTTVLNLKITFYDDERTTLATWIKEWMESMTSVGNIQGVVTPVNNATREVTIIKKSMNRGRTLLTTTYRVFPVGDITYNGTSDSGVPMYSVTFVVVSRSEQQS